MYFSSDESATIRVTNLSEDTRESDLQELFRPFGTIQRIYLAKDKVTGQSKVRKRVMLVPINETLQILNRYFHVETRMHSSGMRAARLLTVSRSIRLTLFKFYGSAVDN